MFDRKTPQIGTTVLRFGLGAVFLYHASLKLFVFTLPGTMGFFESVGFPGWTAIPVTFGELIGGLMLILGVGTRWAALAMVPIMLGAIQVHWANGFGFNNPGGGWEFPAFVALTAGTLFFIGDDLYIYNGGRDVFGGFAGVLRIKRVFAEM